MIAPDSRSKTHFRNFLGLHLFLAGCLLIVITTGCTIRNAQRYYDEARALNEPLDAIIVPGVPFENSAWSRVMELRMRWALHLYEQNITKNLILSGGAIYTPYSESKIMRLYTIEMGISDEHIFLENRAQHSTENVFYSHCIARKNGLEKIALATDPYQAKALKAFVRKLNRKRSTNVILLPAILDSIKSVPKTAYKIDYETAIDSNFINITESQSLMYRLRGTMGLHIDWNETPQSDNGIDQ